MKHRICTSCGFVGEPVSQCAASFLVDALFWLCILSVTFFTGFLPLLALPMAWTIFHIAKFRTTKCPECENLDMVSLNSNKGKSALKH